MDRRYEDHCLVDPLFYDTPSTARADCDLDRELPPDWRRMA